ncbi:hypothetical protein ACIQM4_00465 [Streptomyces sp. NPDC091272]|uniref:hypothetical protein n=1 Tax=Streptomyces sp. NPDC091272 TaxID=3365981 RepID=UPI00382F3398
MSTTVRGTNSRPPRPRRATVTGGGKGPRPVPSLGFREKLTALPAMRGDQVAFLSRAIDKYGDLFQVRLRSAVSPGIANAG